MADVEGWESTWEGKSESRRENRKENIISMQSELQGKDVQGGTKICLSEVREVS